MSPSGRSRRVNEAILQVLSDTVPTLKDPRIGFVTVTAVEATKDFSQATVFVSVLGTPEEQQASLDGLRSAQGYLQSRVGSQIRLKRTPTLEFALDETAARAARLNQLLDEEGDS